MKSSVFLAVDDEPLFVRSVTDAVRLARPDLRVIGTANGAEALEVLDREEVAILLTDLRMPTMDGFELLARLVSRNFRAPIIVATALDLALMERRMHSIPGVHCLEKPIDLDELLKLIDQLLNEEARPADRGLGAFLQLLAAEQKTILLELRSEERSGYLAFLDGRLIDAGAGRLRGDEAVHEILKWPRLTLEPKEGIISSQRTIDTPLQTLLARSSPSLSPPRQETVLSENLARLMVEKAMDIDGALGAAIVDYDSGMSFGSRSSPLNVEPAACANTEFVRTEMATLQALGLEERIEDILITLGLQYHLIRPLVTAPSHFLYLVIDRSEGSLGMAHRQLSFIEKQAMPWIET